jgi:hypothetical protein
MKFEKIIPDNSQIEKLYLLLSKRKYPISHDQLPPPREHHEFVLNNPYEHWYLISRVNKLCGTVYIQSDNCVGINLINPNKDDVLKVINFVKKTHLPLPGAKSLRRKDFFVNISSSNIEMLEILNELDIKEIQRSFVI